MDQSNNTSNIPLTIISVSYHSEKYIRWNFLLSQNLNPHSTINWLIVENSLPKNGKKTYDHTYKVLKGIPRMHSGLSAGSYQHGVAISYALKHVKTRFVLILDPDFFIITKNWVNEVLVHMKKYSIIFFGAPYYPLRYTKYRYFPSAICMFIDLSKVNYQELNFEPEIEEMQLMEKLSFQDLLKGALGKKFSKKNNIEYPTSREMYKDALYQRIKNRILPKRFKYLQSIGSSHDVGYKVFRKFKKYKKQIICLQPSWKNSYYSKSRILSIMHWRQILIKWFEYIIPDKLSLYPKKERYTVSNNFKDYGMENLSEKSWEEYFWRGKPFGFHIRGLFHGMQKVKFSMVSKIINDFKHTEI